MKQVEMTNKEVMTLHRMSKLSEKITKLDLLLKKIHADFWKDFSENHGHRQYKADINNGVVYEIEFEDNG